jgi:hypothetical protein
MITAQEIQMIRNADPGAVLPGIDTETGNPLAASSLLAVASITQSTKAPYYYSPSKNTVYVTQAGAVLSGINFGSATVIIEANNVTIKDCSFSGTTGSPWAVYQAAAYSGATVENCTFQGSKSPTESNNWIQSTLGITIEDNSFLDSPSDAIDIRSGVVTGNYFSGTAYLTGAHSDAIWVDGSTGPTVITDNLIDGTQNADAQGPANSDIRLSNTFGDLTNVTISGNYLLGAGYAVEAGISSSTYTMSDISIADNDIGWDSYGAYFPATTGVATVTGTTIVDSSNPAASTQALTAYEAAGLPTAIVLSATSTANVVASGSAPTTLLGNGFLVHLFGGAGETNFVGGQGAQYLMAGGGANILTYLSIGEGGDSMSGFDPARDVIDLSRMDGDLTKAGIQNFTFIGSAAFSGAGAQVRYQLNPAKNVTYVQADLAGDAGNVTPDFTITLSGLLPLTAANFALTPSQSSADLAYGAALTSAKVKTIAGAPSETEHSNVQGRAYTSYESFSGSGYDNLAADNLNLSATTNQLLLYDPGMTVTRGGGAESLQITGMGSDPLAYHSVETIDATTNGAEQFVLGSAFGAETIKGFAASGATPDTIQLASSSFSYLTAGMTQAQDLAAVLAHAVGGSSGLTIADTTGDSLTLTGVSAATIAANPAAVRFA